MTDSEGTDRLGEATVRRFVDAKNDLLVVIGNFGSMFAAYLDHVRRWESEPDGLSQTFMRQGLGAATLHLSCRPPGDSVGWTINIHRPPTNIFLTGDSRERTVTGRVFTENVKEADKSLLYVQTSRQGAHPVQSTIEVKGLDLLGIFEQYYEQSEQTQARFFEISDEEFLMIHALPKADREWLRKLDREVALGIAEDDLRTLDEATYRFQCGCSPERMMEVVRSVFDKNPSDLFQGDDGVEIFCPRCGRRWWVERDEFESASSDAESEPPSEESGS